MKASQIQLAYATGALTAYTAVTNVVTATTKGAAVALASVVSGTTVSAAGLVLPTIGVFDIEWESLACLIQTNITTNALTVLPVWQCSDEGTNWQTLFPMNGAAYVQTPATGTGSLITTTYRLPLAGINPSAAKLRIAFTTGGATGAAGDNIVASYYWRRRFSIQS